MSKWIDVEKRRPKDGEIVWAKFSDRGTRMVMFTARGICRLWEEDEGRWNGMGSTAEDNWTHWAKCEAPE